MYNSDTELLFPSRVISELCGLRGGMWRDLVNRVNEREPTDPDHLAFVLMMIRLDGCLACKADSYRAMRGCTECAQQTVRRFRGSDQALLDLFAGAREEVEQHFYEQKTSLTRSRKT